MKFNFDTFVVALLLISNTPALAHPQPITGIQLISREDAAALDARNNEPFADISDLWKRKGGGGGGGKGGSGSSGGKGGSSSSGDSSSGSSSSGYVTFPKGSSGSESRSSGVATQKNQGTRDASSTSKSVGGSRRAEVAKRMGRGRESLLSRFGPTFSGASTASSLLMSGHKKPKTKSDKKSSSSSSSSGKGSSSSSTGGSTKTGSGVTPNYGGGRYYGGGSTTPYQSGVRSPLGISPLFLGAGALAFFPGFWLYGAYAYPYYHPYTFYNRTAPRNTTSTKRTVETLVMRQTTDTGMNETKPVTCLCAAYQECGCDDNGNTTFLDSLIGDGTYSSLNQTLVTVADVNGTSTILINGTLPNGTTSSGGTEDAFSAGTRSIVEASGYWVMIVLVGCTVFLV